MNTVEHESIHKKHRKERFLEICLLVLLADESTHGYRLLDQLGQFGYQPEGLDVGSLYRTLRRMEESGLVVSAWEGSDQGPNRRIYNITDSGRENLEARLEYMKSRIEYMHAILAYYDKSKQ